MASSARRVEHGDRLPGEGAVRGAWEVANGWKKRRESRFVARPKAGIVVGGRAGRISAKKDAHL